KDPTGRTGQFAGEYAQYTANGSGSYHRRARLGRPGRRNERPPESGAPDTRQRPKLPEYASVVRRPVCKSGDCQEPQFPEYAWNGLFFYVGTEHAAYL